MDYKQQLASYLATKIDMDASELSEMLEVPPELELGDYALPCFKLARVLKKAPPAIAADIAASLIDLPVWLNECQVAGGYLNFFLNRENFAQHILEQITTEGEGYGASTMGGGRKIVLDYSSINIAKPFHIGHLSTTAIGNSLYKIFNFLGFESVGINYLGDWGTQFGKLIAAYKHWGNKAEIEERSIRGLMDLYVRFHEEAERDSALEDEGRMWFKKIEDGDAEAMEIYNWFKEVTLNEVAKIYDVLGVHFDSYDGEAFFNDKMQPIIDKLEEKGLLVDSDGAKVVMLDEYDLPPCLIVKSDGATLYATRDLAAAFYRKNEYDFYKNLYVVAYQQNLHFRQLFKVLELMGCDWAKDCEHIAFGMVSMADGSMSTRKGRVIFLEDVLDAAITKTRALIEEKNPDLEDKDETARAIGVGALLYSTLSGSRIKDITFDLDRILNFDGETGPYMQYTYARALSVLRKGEAITATPDYSALESGQAFAVLRLLESFPDAIVRAAEKYEPSIITRHITDLAQAFNKFYYDVRILDGDAAASAARLALAQATAFVLKTGLRLLGIDAPERM